MAPQIRLDVAVILKEGLDLAAHRVVGAQHLVRELLSRRGRRVVGAQPILDLAPIVCGRTVPTGQRGRQVKGKEASLRKRG